MYYVFAWFFYYERKKLGGFKYTTTTYVCALFGLKHRNYGAQDLFINTWRMCSWAKSQSQEFWKHSGRSLVSWCMLKNGVWLLWYNMFFHILKWEYMANFWFDFNLKILIVSRTYLFKINTNYILIYYIEFNITILLLYNYIFYKMSIIFKRWVGWGCKLQIWCDFNTDR